MNNLIYICTFATLFACGEKSEGTSPGDCTDGADNDGDGDFDCNDDGCIGSPDCDNASDTGGDGTPNQDEWDSDDDRDGFTENEGDCDDEDASSFPGADDPTVDGVDQDCDGFDGPDNDGDGFAPQTAGGTDCDDTDAAINPDAQEDFTDGIDNNCDGYADMSNVQCTADMTVEFPNEESVTLDFCEDWALQSAFEYDPDNPPELNSMSLRLNATTVNDFECSIQIDQQGICGDGFYQQGNTTGQLVMATMDCSGVSDDNEQTINFTDGYIRFDSINTGTQSGSFTGLPLLTQIDAYVHVWTEEGQDLAGAIAISVEQLAGDAEENVCSVLSPSQIDADGDGDLIPYFDGGDCNDGNADVFTGAASQEPSVCTFDGDGDGYGDANIDSSLLGEAGTDCNDEDPLINPGVVEVWYDGIDSDCDALSDYDQDVDGEDSEQHGGTDCDDTDATIGSLAPEVWYDGIDQDCDGWDDYDQDYDGIQSNQHGGDDCDDTNAFVGSMSTDADCDGMITDHDCDDADPTLDSFSAYDVNCDGVQDIGVIEGRAQAGGASSYILANDNSVHEVTLYQMPQTYMGPFSSITQRANFEFWGLDLNGTFVGNGTSSSLALTGDFIQLSAPCGIDLNNELQCASVYPNYTPPTGSFEQLSCWWNHCCAVDTSGSVQCWGDDGYGQSTPPSGSFKSVSVGESHSCGIDSSGAIQCWGANGSGEATPPAGVFNTVAAGQGYTCATSAKGPIQCWGTPLYSIVSYPDESLPPNEKFYQVSCGSEYCCGITAGGEGRCWGESDSGQAPDFINVTPFGF